MSRRPLVSIIFSVWILLFGAPAWAAASAADTEDLACKSGLCQQVDAMHRQMLDSLDEIASAGTPGLDQATVQRLRRVADHAYASDRMRVNVMRELGQRLDEKDVPVLRRWFSSPAGQVIAKAEQGASDVDGFGADSKGAAVLAAASAARKKLLADILRESRAAEASVDIIINTTLAVRNGVMLASPNAPHSDTGELKRKFDSDRAAMIRSFTQVSLPILASSYAAVSDDDLTSYLRFMKTAQGARFNESSIRSFEAALMIAATEFGQAIPGTRKGLNV
jgi:hypothetical protein